MILNELLLSSFPGKPAGVGASEDQLYVVTTTMTIRKNRRICNDSTMAFFALLQIKVRTISLHNLKLFLLLH